MSTDSLRCSVCGATMKRVKALSNGLARFRCTCGHCEDVKDDKTHRDTEQEVYVLEGFQELQ